MTEHSEGYYDDMELKQEREDQILRGLGHPLEREDVDLPDVRDLPDLSSDRWDES